jgi:diguanylate cyclase (GGDEF)-like protein/PAS domain S-box-containing protein
MEPKEENPTLPPTDATFYKNLLDQMSDGVYFVDRERRILYWNEGAFRLTGYKSDELVGRNCQEDILCHVDNAGRRLCKEDCPLTASINDGNTHEARVYLRHKQGRRVPVLVRVQPLRSPEGAIVGAIEIFSDDSAQNDARRRTEALERLAFLDHLTNMPNRRFLEMTLLSALSEYRVHGEPFGILSVDLNGFKAINDQFGHACGDRAIQESGKALVGTLRPSDTVGRWGGDEFLAIVRNVNEDGLKVMAARCLALFAGTSVPSDDGKAIPISISLGAALVRDGESAKELVERADRLMYECKTKFRSGNAAE